MKAVFLERPVNSSSSGLNRCNLRGVSPLLAITPTKEDDSHFNNVVLLQLLIVYSPKQRLHKVIGEYKGQTQTDML